MRRSQNVEASLFYYRPLRKTAVYDFCKEEAVTEK